LLKDIGFRGCLQIATRHEELETCLPEPIATMLVGQCQYRSNVARVNGAANTTPDLYITAGIITTGFVRTGSDVPSLPVMS